jgi:hypothetical protein
MCIVIAAAALVIALLTGAFIAPVAGNHRGLRINPCALDTGDWREIDPAQS